MSLGELLLWQEYVYRDEMESAVIIPGEPVKGEVKKSTVQTVGSEAHGYRNQVDFRSERLAASLDKSGHLSRPLLPYLYHEGMSHIHRSDQGASDNICKVPAMNKAVYPRQPFL